MSPRSLDGAERNPGFWPAPRIPACGLHPGYHANNNPVSVTRKGEAVTVTSLGELDPKALNMLTLVIVGNSETRQAGQWVYPPQGYGKKLTSE